MPSGLQTLGEEYAQILQLGKNKSSVPSSKILFLSAIFGVFGESLLLQLVRFSAVVINEDEHFSLALKRKLNRGLALVVAAVPSLIKLHLALFYIYGVHRDLTTRILGIGQLEELARYCKMPDIPNRCLPNLGDYRWLGIGALALNDEVKIFCVMARFNL